MNFELESQKTLSRILQELSIEKTKRNRVFLERLTSNFQTLFERLYSVYGWQYDFHYHLHTLVKTLYQEHTQRPAYLQKKDAQREQNPLWHKSNNMLGMAVYVDLFGGDLQKLSKRIPYFLEKGINYVHLMPLYEVPEGESDGGYAVSNYREVNPELGTMSDLRKLAQQFDKHGINLVLDFVFNHTADNHKWAMEAKAGVESFQNYYYMFDDKTIPNQFEHHLREIFPQVRRGNFTFDPSSKKWVWTTFNNFQWDLNYSNPEVFNAIVGEMLFLANVGCDALRLDALAFIWKEMGTNCENQPKAHSLIQAFNACLQITAPAVAFKSEAIVHPDEVVKYISNKECQLSYNPLLMALIWNSLATRKTRLLTASMQKTGIIPADTSWVNYVRCHDDIGWTFDDSVAADLGINGDDHRRFLNQFYTGKFEGSFASGVAFGENPTTGDCRVCGSLASLCGLEKAQEKDDAEAIETAFKRIELVHSVILSVGGIPLLYAGDELGRLNDYSYRQESAKKGDDRWVHRITISNEELTNSPNPELTERLQKLIDLRRNNAIFGESETIFTDAPNVHCFAYKRKDANGKELTCLVNFSESTISLNLSACHLDLTKRYQNLIDDRIISNGDLTTLKGYEVRWLIEVN